MKEKILVMAWDEVIKPGEHFSAMACPLSDPLATI